MTTKDEDSGSQRCHKKRIWKCSDHNGRTSQFYGISKGSKFKRLEFILGCIQGKKGNYSSADGVLASGEISVSSPGFICTNTLEENTNTTVLMQAHSSLSMLESERQCLSALEPFWAQINKFYCESNSRLCSSDMFIWTFRVGWGFFHIFCFLGRRQTEENISVYTVHMQQKTERNEILNMTCQRWITAQIA